MCYGGAAECILYFSELFCKPTAVDHDGQGVFLDDGAYSGEGSKAAVVLATVFL